MADTPFSAGNLKTSLTVLQLAGNRSPALTIKNLNTGEPLFTGALNLVEIIRTAYPGNNFSKRHVYDLEIEIKPDIEVGGIEIWINGWKYTPSDVVLTPWLF